MWIECGTMMAYQYCKYKYDAIHGAKGYQPLVFSAALIAISQ
jgi:hypothetical protein